MKCFAQRRARDSEALAEDTLLQPHARLPDSLDDLLAEPLQYARLERVPRNQVVGFADRDDNRHFVLHGRESRLSYVYCRLNWPTSHVRRLPSVLSQTAHSTTMGRRRNLKHYEDCPEEATPISKISSRYSDCGTTTGLCAERTCRSGSNERRTPGPHTLIGQCDGPVL